MRNGIIWGTVVGFILSGIHTNARANDTATGGKATDLVPIESTDVRMLSEDILINEDDAYWDVTADYVFLNQSDKDVTLQVGFPEHRCGSVPGEEDEPDCISSRPLDFKSMRTTIDGVPVQHRRGKLNKNHPWAPRLGTVWIYDARFPAGKQVIISHHYRVLQTIDSMNARYGDYVTRTGAMWAGSIGHARFRVRFPKKATSLFFFPNDGSMRVESRLIEVEGVSLGEVVFEAEDWNPERDVSYGYGVVSDARNTIPDLGDAPARAGFSESERCPNFDTLRDFGDRIASDPGKEAETVSHWEDKELGSRRICRNMVFARYGRRFKDEALNRYFYGPKGFVQTNIRFPRQPFTPNDSYSDELLTQGDWATLRLIDLIVKIKSQFETPESEQQVVSSEAAESPTSVPVTDKTKPHAAEARLPHAEPQASDGCGCNAINTSPVSRLGLLLLVLLITAVRSRRRLI